MDGGEEVEIVGIIATTRLRDNYGTDNKTFRDASTLRQVSYHRDVWFASNRIFRLDCYDVKGE